MKALKPPLVIWLPLAVALLIVFYPLIWGMVPSPNDIYFNYDPWRDGAFEKVGLNSSLNDPSTGYWTKAALLRAEPSTFLWNPYLACGVPGHADLFSGMLNFFVLLPTLLSLKGWYALMLLMKVAAAYVGMVVLVRAWGMGPAAGAVAGLAWAFFGQNLVLMWWPQTNISVLFPWMLLLPLLKNRKFFFALSCALFLSMLGGGYPTYVLYFFYIFAAYLLGVDRREFFPFLKKAAVPLVLCLLVAAPLLWITWSDLKSTSRLDDRVSLAASEIPVPAAHLKLWLSPDAYGGPQGFNGVPGFPPPNNYHSGAVYMGIPALLLIALGLLGWKNSRNRFFSIAAILLFFLIYVPSPLRAFIARWPGISTSGFYRLFILLGLVLALLAAFGMERLGRVLKSDAWRAAVPVILAVDLGFFAAGFLPYQKWGDVLPNKTEGLAFLEKNLKNTPYRVTALYDALWPNSSEWTRLPDVRSHFTSEGWYRRTMEAVEPLSTHRMGTIITFWDSRTAFHPWLAALYVKYIVEPPMIHTVENGIRERTARQASSGEKILPAFAMKRTLSLMGTPYRIGFTARAPAGARVRLTLRDDFTKNDLEVHEAAIAADDVPSEFWVDLRDPDGCAFGRVEVELRSDASGPVWIAVGEGGDPALAVEYSPLQPVYQGRDMTVFENKAVSASFGMFYHATSEFPASPERWRAQAVVEPQDLPRVEKFLADRETRKNGRVAARAFSLSAAEYEVSAAAPALLVLPFKWNPLWQDLRLDGSPVRALNVNRGMTGLLIPAGLHQVSLSYGRKLIPWFLISVLFLLVLVTWAGIAWISKE